MISGSQIRQSTTSDACQAATGLDVRLAAFRRNCKSGDVEARAFLAAVVDQPGDLDVSHLAPEAVGQIDRETMVEFAALRQAQGHPVRKLILPPGMSGLPLWISELTGLQALHALGLESGDGVRDALHLPGLQLLDLTGGQFPGSEWAGHIDKVRLVLRDANLAGARLAPSISSGSTFMAPSSTVRASMR